MAALRGTGQWLGEAVIGLIPWGGFFVVHRYATLPITAICTSQTPGPPPTASGCTPFIDSPSQEICILAVVISGLAVLSLASLGREKPRQITGWTRFLTLLAIVASEQSDHHKVAA
jgi:hypothetical protein